MSCEGLLPSHADALSPSAQREAMYKNKGMTSVEMRKRRETNTAQLRKQKRESEISKRRNIDQNPDSSVYDEDDSMSGPLEVFDGKNLTKLFSNDPSAQESAMRLFRRRLCAGNIFPVQVFTHIRISCRQILRVAMGDDQF
ncbi:unnamed protein product [Toxocara canis]|uniref:IBB domain-containing protein n=1 Tax=Toxocara canis TaxID=6265 RepID=A0A183VCX0_TOXCA|nr:unnamed protein product [Toxocara canis]